MDKINHETVHRVLLKINRRTPQGTGKYRQNQQKN